MKTAILLLVLGYNFFLCLGPSSKTSPAANNGGIKYVDPYSQLRAGKSLLKEGDLVLRMNNDPLSFQIKNFNRKDKHYSHAGIVFIVGGKPMIFHILNDLGPKEGKLRFDPLDVFADPRQNSAYGIFRYSLSKEELRSLKKKILLWHKNGVRFDPEFDLSSDNRMYCSEMVGKAIEFSTNERISIPVSAITSEEAVLFGKIAGVKPDKIAGMKVIAMDDLYMNKFCRSVAKYEFGE